jgi:hypothetical protein
MVLNQHNSSPSILAPAFQGDIEEASFSHNNNNNLLLIGNSIDRTTALGRSAFPPFRKVCGPVANHGLAGHLVCNAMETLMCFHNAAKNRIALCEFLKFLNIIKNLHFAVVCKDYLFPANSARKNVCGYYVF